MLKCFQGCCQSRDRSPYDSPRPAESSPNPNLPRDSSRAPINPPARSLSNASSTALAQAGSARPNVPIRTPTPVPKSPAKVSNEPPPWSRKRLEKERDAFFETRVSGDAEIWKALRVVCGMVRDGNLSEAQGILDALNVTCPTGRIARDRGKHRGRGGVFDERGELYDIPAWVVTDPQDIVEDKEKEVGDGTGDDEDSESATASNKRDEKGKGRAEDPGESVTVRARLSNTGTDVVVTVGTKEKIEVIVRQILERTGNKRVRLMYLGKTLDERSTLEQSAWKQGHVVNALVFEGDESMLSKHA